MKRSTRVFAMILTVLTVLPLCVFGYHSHVEQNPDVQMPYTSPDVDGNIEQTGVWSAAAFLNDATAGHFWATNPLRSTAELYFAYDDGGLYFAAVITDPAFVFSTGTDDVDNSGTKHPYGWNGDVMTLMLDPLGLFEKSSYQTTPWYNIGIFANGSIHVYRSQAGEADITSRVTASGGATMTGWRFEVKIPWSIVAADVSSASSGKLSASEAALRAKNAISRAAVMYMDRYKNGSATETWGRYITVCEKTYDNYSGTSTSGVVAKAYGIKLVNTGTVPHRWGDWTFVSQPSCTEAGSRSRTCTDCGLTETEPVPALGHSWSSWTVVTQPTETESGLRRRVCLRCNTEETAVIAPTGNEKPIIVAYYNASVSTVNEFADIDVLNYHPATIANAYPSADPLTHNYSSSLSSFRARVNKQNAGAKILFTLASNNLQVFESWVTNDTASEKMAGCIVDVVRQYGFDGVDIDYEFPSVSGLSAQAAAAKKAGFVYFMTALREKLTALSASTGKDYLLTMAVPGTTWSFTLFDMVSLQEQVDWFNIMNYDTYVNRGSTLHHTSPFDNALIPGGSTASDIAAYQDNGIRPDKIVPGCGLYARRWTNVSPGPNGDGLYQAGTIDMDSQSAYLHYSVLKSSYINKNGYVKYWDDDAKAPYLYNASSKIFLSYDDEESVSYKCDLVSTSGVRGIMVFDYCTCDGEGLFAKMRGWLDEGLHFHSFTPEVTKAPTCTQPGVRTFTCACGYSYTETVPALGHDYVPGETSQPSCTEEGTAVFTCSRCGDSYTETVPALGHDYVPGETSQPSCTEEGTTVFTCSRCGDSYTETVPAKGHVWGEWAVTREPTPELAGERERVCTVCGVSETEQIEWIDPDAPKPVINGFFVSVSETEGLNYIRFAPGSYTSSAELRRAPGLVQLDAGTIARYTADGVFRRELPSSGEYTFWFRYDNGRTYIVKCVCEKPAPRLVTEGITITVQDIEDVYDIFFAKGMYSTYRQVADNAVMNVTGVKIGGAHKYSYAVAEKGVYTVCIRDRDKSPTFLYTIVNVPSPTISTFGLTVTVGNIADLKVLRAAPGEYSSSGEVKRAPGVRNFTSSATGGADSYTAFFAAEGVYTLAVQYKNGYIEIHTVELTKPAPTVEKRAAGVTFGSLAGLRIIRFAPGTYTSIAEVKRAPGAEYVKAASVNGDTVSFDGLDGVYTFALQYEDLTVSLHVLEFTTEEQPMLDIADKRQLFAEDGFIDETLTTASRTVHSPEKKEQAFNYDASWESVDTVYQNIVTLPDGSYRMYYKATSGKRRIAYLESSDGLHWTRPRLTTYIENGTRTNCVTDDTSSPDNMFVFYDNNPNCEQGKRWKGVYGQWGDGLYLEWSVNDQGNYFPFWLNGETPYESAVYGELGVYGQSSEMSGGCFFDSLNTMYWDAARGKYVAFVRGFHEGDNYQLTADYVRDNPAYIIRDIRYAESSDGVTWTIPTPLVYSDGTDWQMYANAITPYPRAEGLYVGIPTRYNVTSTDGSSVTGAYTDNLFMVSRDLVNWTRYDVGGYMLAHDGSQKPLIYGDSYPCVGMIETSPGELSLYMKEKASGTSFEGRTVLYRYALRTDGFVSMSDGTATTLPLTFDGGKLLVNYKARSGGSLTVRITDSKGGEYVSLPLTGDEIDGEVVFEGQDLASLAGKTVRVSFEMKDAEIYSFKFGN